MPLPQETLSKIKANLDEASKLANDIEETIADLRVSGIDASAHEERLRSLKEEIRKWSGFYERQTERTR